jgi:hypothetical protein
VDVLLSGSWEKWEGWRVATDGRTGRHIDECVTCVWGGEKGEWESVGVRSLLIIRSFVVGWMDVYPWGRVWSRICFAHCYWRSGSVEVLQCW